MIDILEQIRQDEKEYDWICSQLKIPKKNSGNMYDHYPKIFKKFNVKNKMELIQLIYKINDREKKINNIIKDE